MTIRLLYCVCKILEGLTIAVFLCFTNSHNSESIRSYAAFCSSATGVFSQVEGHHVDHLLSSSAKFKNECSYIYTVVAFSGKEMDKFTLKKRGTFISFPHLVH
jgi:hypothetical protein